MPSSSPGKHGTKGELDSADLHKCNRALADLGYAIVSEELLERDYRSYAFAQPSAVTG
ncbi:hypothetical protein [Streptomyces roseoverticillatus]|uniref:hypothetical protein n=1 Tax=Streptomyces roseoverticillatus TaxID=66429 RepID=UPI000A664BE7|nr:hypothetical protein [Streptomyces roseoverticillatus]